MTMIDRLCAMVVPQLGGCAASPLDLRGELKARVFKAIESSPVTSTSVQTLLSRLTPSVDARVKVYGSVGSLSWGILALSLVHTVSAGYNPFDKPLPALAGPPTDDCEVRIKPWLRESSLCFRRWHHCVEQYERTSLNCLKSYISCLDYPVTTVAEAADAIFNFVFEFATAHENYHQQS